MPSRKSSLCKALAIHQALSKHVSYINSYILTNQPYEAGAFIIPI